MKCKWYLCKNLVETKNIFCSGKCRNKAAVTRKRRELKTQAVEYKGGCCYRCGYSKSNNALQFHHEDSTVKEFGISSKGTTRAWEIIKTELDKCVLVCANCHAEIHEEEYLEKIGDSLDITVKRNQIILPVEKVKEMVKLTSYTQVAKELGVSDNTVKRYILH